MAVTQITASRPPLGFFSRLSWAMHHNDGIGWPFGPCCAALATIDTMNNADAYSPNPKLGLQQAFIHPHKPVKNPFHHALFSDSHRCTITNQQVHLNGLFCPTVSHPQVLGGPDAGALTPASISSCFCQLALLVHWCMHSDHHPQLLPPIGLGRTEPPHIGSTILLARGSLHCCTGIHTQVHAWQIK